VSIKDNWMRLDFDNDGKVSVEDLKRDIQELYNFMKNYNYFDKVLEIKSKLYSQAINFMKTEI